MTKLVAVADGDEVKVFDGHLNLVRTLAGFAAPQGVAATFDGRIYVADTGNNRVLRYTAGGELDSSFNGTGALTDAVGVPLRGPTSVIVEEKYRFTDADDDHVLQLLDLGNERVVECRVKKSGRVMCAIADGFGADDLVVPHVTQLATRLQEGFPDRPSGEAAVLAHGRVRFARDGTAEAPATIVTPSTQINSVALAEMLTGFGTYLISTTEDGRVLDSLVQSDRRALLRSWVTPYPAQLAVADPTASRALVYMKLKWDDFPRYETGPIVAFIAGAGHLQRIVFPSLAVEAW
jgi:hypothetical protein